MKNIRRFIAEKPKKYFSGKEPREAFDEYKAWLRPQNLSYPCMDMGVFNELVQKECGLTILTESEYVADNGSFVNSGCTVMRQTYAPDSSRWIG